MGSLERFMLVWMRPAFKALSQFVSFCVSKSRKFPEDTFPANQIFRIPKLILAPFFSQVIIPPS